ncbi:MAG: NAD(P)H-binding protein [Acidimicrobiales bacterium]|nr:NAD(P)H-binding protein [Acidimicrobiales bacterium]
MITVMGATGNTGRKITAALLAAGEDVRALGRDRTKLAALADAGAEVRAGDAGDPTFLAEAFRGADAVYALLPVDLAAPDYHTHQSQVGEATVASVRAAGVRHVVVLSSIGAEVPSGTGFITSLHRQEARWRALADEGVVDVLLLRPGAFYESFRAALPVIAQEGVNADAVAPDVRIPMVATADIAAAAAAALVARDWQGVEVRELVGPRDLSYAEATSILGTALGRPDLAYVQLPYGEMTQVLIGAGLSADVARHAVEMARAFNDGLIRTTGARRLDAPTPFEDVAAELAAAVPAA